MVVAAREEASNEPEFVIEPPRGWVGPELAEIWRFRDLLLILSLRDLKIRYKQTLLGVVWVVVQPLIAAGIFTFVFGNVASFEAPGGVPYFLFSFTGLLAWNLFANTLTKSSSSLVANSHFIQKIYFPRLILPTSKTSSAMIDFSVALGMLAVLLLLFWRVPGAELLLLPLCVLLFVLLSLGIGFAATAAAVYFRDVNYVVPVAVQFLLYASPVAYPVQEVPLEHRDLFMLNPLAGLLEGFRWSILGVGEVPWAHFTYAGGVSVLVFVAGILIFKRFEPAFPDVI